MLDLEKIIEPSRFLHSIDKYARKKQLKVAEEIRQIEREKLQKEEVKIVENARALMMSELSNVKGAISLKIYNAKAQSSREIYKKRSEVEKKIFDSCRARLETFTESEEYFDKLKKSTSNASKILGKSLKVFIRKKDAKHIEPLSKLFPSANILASNKIKSGGLFFENNNKVIDETFESCLREQKSWFRENCHLKLN